MEYTPEMIEKKLCSYHQLEAQLLLLQHELECPATITSAEVLDALALGSPKADPGSRSCGSFSDRTPILAANYRKTAEAMNEEVREQIVREWNMVFAELSRLNTYLGLLADEQRQVICARCIDRKPWKQIEQETGISRRTLVRRKKEALDRLAEMFSFVNRFHRNAFL